MQQQRAVLWKKLTDLYYNPQTGFQSAAKLYAKARDPESGVKVTLKQVKEFLAQQETAQVQRPALKPSIHSIRAYPGDCFQIDIMVYSRWTFHNYSYIHTFSASLMSTHDSHRPER